MTTTSLSLGTAIDRQSRSRFRSPAYVIGVFAPVILISLLLFQTAKATKSPATVVFLSILSALWVGGSSCIREIVDERRLVREADGLLVWTAPPSCVIGRSRPSRTLRRATCRCTPFDTWPRRLRRSPNVPGCAWRRARA